MRRPLHDTLLAQGRFRGECFRERAPGAGQGACSSQSCNGALDWPWCIVRQLGMAIYTTVFAATSAELHAAFPGWRTPLASPVRRKGVHPFTKEPITYDSWEPEDDVPAVTSDVTFPAPSVVVMSGDYSAYLEGRLPAGVARLPHLAAKSVLSPHVDALLAAVAGQAMTALRPGLFPPRSSGSDACLDLWPAESVPLLAGIGEAAKPALRKRIAEAEWFADEEWALSDVTWLLDGLIRVAKAAAPAGRSLFLLTEP